MGVTRWNPQARAGAVSFRPRNGHDAKALQHVTESVSSWAKYQNLSGELDSIETSCIQGTYDWRAYLQEEAQIAHRREESKQPAPKKPSSVPTPAAPSVFYA